jgi:hypothetical protein
MIRISAQHRPAMPNEAPRKNFGIRLPDALITAIGEAALARKQTRTEIVERAISAYLGVDAPAPAMPSTMESRLSAIESRLEALEHRLAPPNEAPNTTPATTPSTTPSEAQNEPPSATPCNVTATPSTPNEPPSTTPSTTPSATPSTPPSEPPSEPHTGLSIAEALIAARAPITAQQARGGNRDRIMRSRTGQSGRAWLEGQGWEERSRRWVPPSR